MPTKKKRKPNPRPVYAPSPEAAHLTYLRLSDPDAWHRVIAEALRKAGSMRGAAKELEVSLGVMQRALRDDPTLAKHLTLQVGNPEFGPGYGAGKKRGEYKKKAKKRTSSLKSKG